MGLSTITGTSDEISTPGIMSKAPFFSSKVGTAVGGGERGWTGSQQSAVSPSVTLVGKPLTSSRGVPVPLLVSELLPPLLIICTLRLQKVIQPYIYNYMHKFSFFMQETLQKPE